MDNFSGLKAPTTDVSNLSTTSYYFITLGMVKRPTHDRMMRVMALNQLPM